MRKFLLRGAAVALFGGALAGIALATWVPRPIEAPLLVIDEPTDPVRFFVSGWLAEFEGGAVRYRQTDEVRVAYRPTHDAPSGSHAVRVELPAGRSQVGVDWQYPEGNWGRFAGYRLEGISELSVWLRGAHGGEKVRIRVGGIPGLHGDSARLFSPELALEADWREYRFDLSRQSFANLVSALGVFVYADSREPSTVFWIDRAELR